MKPTHSRLPRLLLALLAAGLLLPTLPLHAAKTRNNSNAAANQSLDRARNAGQSTRNSIRKKSRPDGADGPMDNTAEDWYLELTPGYMRAGGPDIGTFLGASLALGYKLSLVDRLQIEIGYYRSNNYTGALTYTRNFDYELPDGTLVTVSNVPYTGTKQAQATAIPILLSYSYNLALDPAERWEFRFTAATGAIRMSDTWSITNAKTPVFYTPLGDPMQLTENFTGRASGKYALALGGGVGLTWHITDRWYADAGFRYLWLNTVTNNLPATGAPWNGTKAWNGMNLHHYTLTLGWRF